MKIRKCVLVATLLSIVALTAAGVPAQKRQKLSATPKAFQTFYAKFRTAAAKGDKAAVAAMTRFPFIYGFDAGDEGTFTRSQFIQRFNDMFGGKRAFFSRRDPVLMNHGGAYTLTDESDASHYVFEKVGPGYRLKAFIVEP